MLEAQFPGNLRDNAGQQQCDSDHAASAINCSNSARFVRSFRSRRSGPGAGPARLIQKGFAEFQQARDASAAVDRPGCIAADIGAHDAVRRREARDQPLQLIEAHLALIPVGRGILGVQYVLVDRQVDVVSRDPRKEVIREPRFAESGHRRSFNTCDRHAVGTIIVAEGEQLQPVAPG